MVSNLLNIYIYLSIYLLNYLSIYVSIYLAGELPKGPSGEQPAQEADRRRQRIHQKYTQVREDTHKKSVFFLVVGPLRFYPSYT